MSDVFSKWRKDAAEVPWVEVDSEDLTAMLDALEAVEGELTYKYTDDQRRINFPKTAHRLARFYDLIGDDL